MATTGSGGLRDRGSGGLGDDRRGLSDDGRGRRGLDRCRRDRCLLTTRRGGGAARGHRRHGRRERHASAVAIGDGDEIPGEVPAGDVAQQGAQVTAQLEREVAHLAIVDGRALHQRDLDGLGHLRTVTEPGPVLRAGAERGQALAEQLGAELVGLEQGAERQERVGERLGVVGTLAGELEASQRPGRAALEAPGAGDEVAEAAHGLGMGGLEVQGATGAGAGADERVAGPAAAAHAGPRHRGERRRGTVVEAQCGEEGAQARARDREPGGATGIGEHVDDGEGAGAPAHRRASIARQVGDHVVAHEREAVLEVEALGLQAHAEHRNDDRRLLTATHHAPRELGGRSGGSARGVEEVAVSACIAARSTRRVRSARSRGSIGTCRSPCERR